jgi:isopentenyl-diphosphate delta-isomerase
MPQVILVDKKNKAIGKAKKLEAHEKGLLHRAFSICIINSKQEILLQKRAEHKYHCGGLWSNTTCSHPVPGESIIDAAHRRLQEEMGFDTSLKEIFQFQYKTKFKNGLTENEWDHVLIGQFAGQPQPNSKEVSECRWIDLETLEKEFIQQSEKYTPWFHIMWPKLRMYLSEQ